MSPSADALTPPLSIAVVQARHRARLGWPVAHPADAAAQAQAWGASLPGVDPLLLQIALAAHDGWPSPSQLQSQIAHLLERGVLVLQGRPATDEDLAIWPETLSRLKEVPLGLSPREEATQIQQRALDVEVWLRRIPVHLHRGLLVLDTARAGGALPQVLPGLLTGGHGNCRLSWHLSEIQTVAECSLALRFASTSRLQATA